MKCHSPWRCGTSSTSWSVCGNAVQLYSTEYAFVLSYSLTRRTPLAVQSHAYGCSSQLLSCAIVSAGINSGRAGRPVIYRRVYLKSVCSLLSSHIAMLRGCGTDCRESSQTEWNNTERRQRIRARWYGNLSICHEWLEDSVSCGLYVPARILDSSHANKADSLTFPWKQWSRFSDSGNLRAFVFLNNENRKRGWFMYDYIASRLVNYYSHGLYCSGQRNCSHSKTWF